MFKHMFKDKYNNKVKNITIPSTTMEWIDTLILLLFFFNIYIYICNYNYNYNYNYELSN